MILDDLSARRPEQLSRIDGADVSHTIYRELRLTSTSADHRLFDRHKMRTLGEANAPAFFRPEFNGQLFVRVSGNPGNWIGPLRSALSEIDPNGALDVRPLAEAAAGALFP